MKTLRLIAQINDQHQLYASVPSEIPAGPVEIVVTIPDLGHDEDDAGAAWAMGIAHEWSSELGDSREDIYTLNDGEPVDGRR